METSEIKENYVLAMSILAEVRAVLLTSVSLSEEEREAWRSKTKENAAEVANLARRIASEEIQVP